VDALVLEPGGVHPSYLQGYWDRDNAAYLEWDRLSRDPAQTEAWLAEWVFGVANRQEYSAKIPAEVWNKLRPAPALAAPVDYGDYR